MPALRVVTVSKRDERFEALAQGLAERIPRDLGLGEKALAWYADELRRTYPHAVVHAQDELARTEPDTTIWYAHNGGPIFRIDTGVDVPLALERAYAVYVERVVEWQTAVRLSDVRRTPDLVGSEYAARFDLLGHSYTGRFLVTDADPPNSVSLEASGSGISVWYVTSFAATGPGTTHMTVRGDYRLPDTLLARIADRLFLERTIAREIDRANRAYRSICEAIAAVGV